MTDDDLSNDDKDLFAKAMQNVKPLKQKNHKLKRAATKVQSKKVNKAGPTLSKQTTFSPNHYHLSDSYQTNIMADEILSYKTKALSDKLFRQFIKSRIKIDNRIDLHGLRVDEARDVLCQFILDASKSNAKYLLVIHGKGGKSNSPPILKNCVNHWLKQFPQVLAFHSAHLRDGGPGAVYVLLKKY
jgi:DNA-nicking Smr family endonuclease